MEQERRMRLIDADELLQTVSIKSVFGDEINKMKCGELRKILEMIENAPTIEPPRMRGKWETIEGWDGDEVYRCSACGEEYVLIDGTPKENGYHFCPNCGAWMEGQDET